MKTDYKNYPIFIIYSNEDKAYIAFAPHFQGCRVHDDDNPKKLIEKIYAEVKYFIEVYKELGWEIPDSSSQVVLDDNHILRNYISMI